MRLSIGSGYQEMDFWEVIDRRCSVREFDASITIGPEVVDKLLYAAISAPSAGNCQPWRFIVVTHPRIKRALAEAAYGQMFISDAHVVIAVCAEPTRSAQRYGKRGETLYCLQDTAAAIENILLAATALELGACWVGAFDESRVSQVLEIGNRLRPVALIPIGKPVRPPCRETSRRGFSEVVTRQD